MLPTTADTSTIYRWWRCTACVVIWSSPTGECWCCGTAADVVEGTMPDFRGPAQMVGIEGVLTL